MESSSYKVVGPTVEDLSRAVSRQLGATAFVKHGNVSVVCHEKFYLRIESNLMTTIIFSITDEEVCFVDIISGGGRTGFLGIGFGAEGAHIREVTGVVESVCSDLLLDITPA